MWGADRYLLGLQYAVVVAGDKVTSFIASRGFVAYPHLHLHLVT